MGRDEPLHDRYPLRAGSSAARQDRTFRGGVEDGTHKLGRHGLDKASFYSSPIFGGAIEKVRGEFSATMRGKREFVQHVLNHMEDGGFISGWDRTRPKARNDHYVQLNSGRLAVVDLKRCLDGDNTNKFERPTEADDFITWSFCTNSGADPRRNAWSGIHTRLSAEMISGSRRVDGVVTWDMICGTLGRPRPNLGALSGAVRRTSLGPFLRSSPCIYVFPAEIPSRGSPWAIARDLGEVELLTAFQEAFGGRDEEMNYFDFEISEQGSELFRRTVIRRGGVVQHASEMTGIQRV